MGVWLGREFPLPFKRDIRRNAFSLSLDDFFFCTVQHKGHKISNRIIRIIYEAVCVVLKDVRNWVLESVVEMLNEPY